MPRRDCCCLRAKLSPIDLIPDFIPVLGYVDDLILLPFGIYLAVKLIPEPLWHEFQTQVEKSSINLPKSWPAALAIGLFWCVSLAAIYALWRTFKG